MREIKFRGISEKGEWVYGSVVVNEKFNSLIVPIDAYHSSPLMLNAGVWVNRKTVGQYTGLKDKNGKEIYEGDICETVTYSGKPFGTIDVVKFSDGAFKLTDIEDALLPIPLDDSDIQSVEVIGNIYENPHLLEERT